MCKCCETIEFWKEHKSENVKEKIFAKISVYSWEKHIRAIKSNRHSEITSRAFTLNYCPECGRKVGK